MKKVRYLIVCKCVGNYVCETDILAICGLGSKYVLKEEMKAVFP